MDGPPIRPGRAAGYSGTPLAKKLGVKDGHRIVLVDAPSGWNVPDLPAGVNIRRRKRSSRARTDQTDGVIVFVSSLAILDRAREIARALPPDSFLWVAWPRRAGGHQSDVTEQAIRDAMLPIGVVDVKVAAFDHDWSGLKLVWRLQNRSTKEDRR